MAGRRRWPPSPSWAPRGAAAAQIAPAADVDELVVTGVRGAAAHGGRQPDADRRAERDRTAEDGRAGAFQALQTLVPSFNLPARAGGGTSTVIATGGLRGLNPDQTLVLVNGKRRHKTALINSVSSLYNGSVPADLDLIPTSAIGRIEVLRDGAAAQYGSDAIAGGHQLHPEGQRGRLGQRHPRQNFDRNDGDFTYVPRQLRLQDRRDRLPEPLRRHQGPGAVQPGDPRGGEHPALSAPGALGPAGPA